nr:MAG TPA: tail tape measure protein [Caudoviricetes sp.]
MENIDKIINIRVKYSDLIKGMSESAKRIDTLNDRISELKSGLKGLKAARKAGTIDEEAYNEQVAQTTQELVANREEVKALQSAMRLYSREIQDNIKEEKNLEGSVNGLRKSVRDLTAQYNALSAADREGSVGNGIAERISKMQAQVSAAEQRLGNFRSNVGNYQSAFNGLNVSVSQIVRELPSATMGANMFFLAISNNIPMLVDEINKLRAANKLAMKEGKQGVPILKQLGAAVFSWNSLISVGITLLTVYGKDIVSWIGNLFKGREAAMTMAEAQAEVNKQMAESSGSYGDQVAQLRTLQLQWNQLGDDLKAKTEFVKNNREAFDKLGVAITTVADADNLFIQNTDAFIEAMNLRAQANAANELATQKYKDALIARQKAEDKIKRGTGEIVYAGIDEYGDTSYEYRRRAYTEDEKKEILAEVEALEAEASAFTQLTVARNADAKSILDRAGIKESEKSSKSANDDPYADESGVKKAERMMEGYYARSKQELQKWVDEQREIIRKTGIDVMGDFEKILSQMDKEVSAEFISQYNQKQSEYRNRILNAQATGGDEAAQNETVAILREQLAEFDSYAAAYRAMGDSAIEIDNRRLEMLIRLHDEMNKGAQKEAQSMQMSFQTASDLAGALAGLAEEAGAGAPVVAVLGMAQAIASMGAALSKAFSTGNIWEGIAASITAIATITSVISQMKSLNSTAAEEGAKYHYARGGLVTGPGTGTSDSIPARLSNGEAVMTARAVVDWGPVLSMMNVSSGGNAIPTRHLPEKSSGMRQMEQMFERVMRRLPNPVVTVRDINNGQRRVKVQDETARYAGRKR